MNIKNIEDYLSKLQIIESGIPVNGTVLNQYYSFIAPDLGWLICNIANTGIANSYNAVQEVTAIGKLLILCTTGSSSSGQGTECNRILVQKNHEYLLYRSASNVTFTYYKLGIPEINDT